MPDERSADKTFTEVARDAGWKPDYSIPVQDHAFYKQRTYWRNGDLVQDEWHLRYTLGFGGAAE